MSDVNAQITAAMESSLNAPESKSEVQTAQPQVVQPEAPKPVNLSDDALITYKVGGQEFTKPWKEVLQTQVLLPGDYTKKTQALALERKSVEDSKAEAAKWQSERQQIYQALQDPQKVGAIYLAALGRAKAEGQSPAQAHQTAQAAVDPQQIFAKVEEHLNQRFEEYQTNIARKEIEQDLDSFVGGLRKGTQIEDLPGVDDYIYSEVEKMKPSSVDEAKQFAKTVFDGYHAWFTGKLQAEKKAGAVSQAKLTNGIEPPGGSVVQTGPKTYTGHQDPARIEDILKYMQQHLGT